MPNNTVSVCQREVQAITCNVTGSVLIWEYGTDTASFSTGNTMPAEIGPFHLALLSHDNGILASVATVNVSTSINESTLECRNTGFITDSSIRRQISFNVKGK